MADELPRIDHLMVIVGDRLDEAVDTYGRLGFALTPRGHHSVGTSNHLAIFKDDYFELLGHEPQNAARAKGAWTHVEGFAGVILKTGDADATAKRLRTLSIGMTGGEPRRLSRPVELADGSVQEARFSSIHLDPALTQAGLVLICEHHTPELVWQTRFQTHPNGVSGIAGMTVASGDPGRSIALLGGIYDGAAVQRIDGGLRLACDGSYIDYVTPESATARFGDDIVLSPDGTDRNVAIEFRTASRDATRSVLRAAGMHASKGEAILVPASAAFGVALTFGVTD